MGDGCMGVPAAAAGGMEPTNQREGRRGWAGVAALGHRLSP